jgi:hypothetical protein
MSILPFRLLSILSALLIAGCCRQECHDSLSVLLEKAVRSPQNSTEQVAALKELTKSGKQINIPKNIWVQGPSAVENKSSTEDLEGMKSTKLVQIDGIHFIFSGSLEGKSYLVLLAIRSFPDGKIRFVSLVEAAYVGM